MTISIDKKKKTGIWVKYRECGRIRLNKWERRNSQGKSRKQGFWGAKQDFWETS